MYNTQSGKPPKRPVITSLTGANRELETWLAENDFHRVPDADGAVWALRVDVTQVPDGGVGRAKPNGVKWQLKLRLTTAVTGKDLVQTGVLKRGHDDRLLNLVGDRTVEIAMKPLVYSAPHEEAARLLLAETLPRVKDGFSRQSLKEIKRALVGKHVDKEGRFGVDALPSD